MWFSAHIKTDHGEIIGLIGEQGRAMLEEAIRTGGSVLVVKIDTVAGHTVHMGVEWPFCLILRQVPVPMVAYVVGSGALTMTPISDAAQVQADPAAVASSHLIVSTPGAPAPPAPPPEAS